MKATIDWPALVATLGERGWRARVVEAARLEAVRRRVGRVLASGELPPGIAPHLADETSFTVPGAAGGGARAGFTARSVVVGAFPRPLTQAALRWHGQVRVVPVPPHYAGYRTVPQGLADAVAESLAAQGYEAARCDPPLKALAAGAGLARYGRNNITYVDGVGSYFQLAACVTEAPPPAADGWGEARQLERCEGCPACRQACPTGAIGGGRFLLRTERCLTALNEDERPFPAWVNPAWHTCAVGCLRCQLACPENAAVALRVAPPERFDEAETAALLAGAGSGRIGPRTREKLARCGLDYSPALIARNLRALLGA